MRDRPNVDQAGRIFDALGHATRRDILALLRTSPLAVGEIADQFPISRPAISKHLRILEEAGLVTYTEEGTRNIFSLTPTGFQDAKAHLEQFWEVALANFKKLSESSHDL